MTRPALSVSVELSRGDFRLQVELEAGREVLVLFGPSGAGKSTTLQAIAGLVTPERGRVSLNGQTLFRRVPGLPTVNLPPRKRRIGYVFQDLALFPHLTALENVAFPLRGRRDAHRRAGELLARMGLSGLEDRFPHQLSGGQQQRVALARALALEPQALLLDEPFSALDVETRRRVREEVRRVLREAGVPVVLVTHDREEALALGDKVAILDRGRVLAVGEPLRLLGHPPRERVARLMGVENILRLRVRAVHPDRGVMMCTAGEATLEIPLTDARPGDEITVGLRADDVLLSVERPRGLSAGNAIPCRVVSVRPLGALYEVELDCGFPLTSHVTHRTVEAMHLAPGRPAWAVFKTSSCFPLAG